MSSSPKIDAALREAILARPEDVLDDRDMMQALVASNEKRMGANVVDMRGIAMERLEQRLDRLEDTHRSVIAAAYENLAGTNQIHRAVLNLLEADDLGIFLSRLNSDVADVLRVDAIRLVIEVSDEPLVKDEYHGVLSFADPGFIKQYLTQGGSGRPRDVTLRAVPKEAEHMYGDATQTMGSEACIQLDFDDPALCGVMCLGAQDATLFTPQQGTDLLVFLGGVVERLLRRWVP